MTSHYHDVFLSLVILIFKIYSVIRCVNISSSSSSSTIHTSFLRLVSAQYTPFVFTFILSVLYTKVMWTYFVNIFWFIFDQSGCYGLLIRVFALFLWKIIIEIYLLKSHSFPICPICSFCFLLALFWIYQVAFIIHFFHFVSFQLCFLLWSF